MEKGSFWVRLAGHIGFLVLMVLSVVLANERVLFIDSAAQLFEMIQRGTFVIYDHRYTMAVTQLLPLLGIKLGLPLPLLVVLYSVAAPLLGYLAFLWLTYRVKDLPLALLLLLPMLCIRHTFFHAISETFSLAIYATLLLALLRHPGGTLLRVAGVVFCTLACVFMHPIGMFFVLFLLGYQLVDRTDTAVVGRRFRPFGSLAPLRSPRPSPAFLVCVATLVAAAAVKLSLPSGHDDSYLPSVADFLYYLRHPGEMTVLRQFAVRLPDLYFYPLVLYAIAIVWHLRRRQWLRLGWGVAFNAGFILLTAIVYHADAGHIAVERAWLPLVFFAGVPVACEVIPAAGRRIQGTAPVLFSLLLLLAFGKIAASSRLYRQRIEWLQTVVDEGRREGHRKLVAPLADVRDRFKVQSWATAFETLILSSTDGPEGTVTLYLEEEEPFNENIPDYEVEDAYLAVPWNRLWSYATLDPRYFRLPLQGSTVIRISP